MDEFNPFKAPEAGISPDGPWLDQGPGYWLEGGNLVMHKAATLPDRCFQCGEPALGYRLQRKLYWHPGAYYLLIFLHLFIYFIVALIVRKKATIFVGLCPRHRAARRRNIFIAVTAFVAGVGLLIAGAAAGEDSMIAVFIILGMLMILFGLVYGMSTTRIVIPARIDDRFVWLKRVSPRFLAKIHDSHAPAKEIWVKEENVDELDQLDEYVP